MIPKFRAYCDRKISEVIKIDYEGNWVCDEPHVVGKGSCELLPLSEVKLMQSTGLKDKNGVEIFEGDIVKVRDGDNEEDSYISVVKNYSDEGYPAFDIEYPSEWYYESNVLSAIENNPYETIEVIGNVYENRELLEGL